MESERRGSTFRANSNKSGLETIRFECMRILGYIIFTRIIS